MGQNYRKENIRTGVRPHHILVEEPHRDVEGAVLPLFLSRRYCGSAVVALWLVGTEVLQDKREEHIGLHSKAHRLGVVGESDDHMVAGGGRTVHHCGIKGKMSHLFPI